MRAGDLAKAPDKPGKTGTFWGSSSGRTTGFDPVNQGSNPCPQTNKKWDCSPALVGVNRLVQQQSHPLWVNRENNMGTPHKHRDIIIAWANGEEIEWRYLTSERWFSLCGDSPDWGSGDCDFRIKPKIAKREGWVNIYQYELAEIDRKADLIHPTKESADAFDASRKACIRIEWEE